MPSLTEVYPKFSDIPQYKNVVGRITEQHSGVCRDQTDSGIYMQFE
jgi:hypothetical protein